MGSKRPDQYDGRNEGRSVDEHILDHDKQLERKTETDDARRAQKVGKDADDASRDRVDEASEESFPASDPPQQP